MPVIISVQKRIHKPQFLAKQRWAKVRVMLPDLMGKEIYLAHNLMSLCKFLYLVPLFGEAASGLLLSHITSG